MPFPAIQRRLRRSQSPRVQSTVPRENVSQKRNLATGLPSLVRTILGFRSVRTAPPISSESALDSLARVASQMVLPPQEPVLSLGLGVYAGSLAGSLRNGAKLRGSLDEHQLDSRFKHPGSTSSPPPLLSVPVVGSTWTTTVTFGSNRFATYTLLEKIGSGGFGNVYKAEATIGDGTDDAVFPKHVAVKLISKGTYRESPECIKTEVEVMKLFSDQDERFLCQALAFWQCSEWVCIAMVCHDFLLRSARGMVH
jgi:hypothetical protein